MVGEATAMTGCDHGHGFGAVVVSVIVSRRRQRAADGGAMVRFSGQRCQSYRDGLGCKVII